MKKIAFATPVVRHFWRMAPLVINS